MSWDIWMVMRKLTDNVVQYPLGVTDRLAVGIPSVIRPQKHLYFFNQYVTSMYDMNALV